MTEEYLDNFDNDENNEIYQDNFDNNFEDDIQIKKEENNSAKINDNNNIESRDNHSTSQRKANHEAQNENTNPYETNNKKQEYEQNSIGLNEENESKNKKDQIDLLLITKPTNNKIIKAKLVMNIHFFRSYGTLLFKTQLIALGKISYSIS